jgi:hypothetical protein
MFLVRSAGGWTVGSGGIDDLRRQLARLNHPSITANDGKFDGAFQLRYVTGLGMLQQPPDRP